MSQPKRRRRAEGAPAPRTPVERKKPAARRKQTAPLLRLPAAAAALLLVVLLFARLSRHLVPADPVLSGAEAEISLVPTGEPTPSPVPTITPTPRAYAPFGAQYGYGGSDLIPETPAPEADGVLFTPQPRETPTPEPTEAPQRTLRRGMKGDDVREMQEALKALGYLEGAADGDFGAGTHAALVAFQAVNGLAADGVAGQRTFAALYGGSAKSADQAPPADFLVLANREHPLDKNYAPATLVSIGSVLPESLVKVKKKGIQADRTAVAALGEMLTAAAAEGLTDWQISSAFRTYAEQQRLVDNSVEAYLRNHSEWTRKRALSATYNTVAPAGTSEHQTGLAFDVTVPGESFTGTKQQKWMHAHCHEYGFVVRYTEEKQKITGFIAESWHIRYVGREAASIMVKNNWCLEEYLEVLSGQ